MKNTAQQFGEFDDFAAAEVFARDLQGVTTDHLVELTYADRKRIHNLKYYTWVEQQGKTYQEIQAQWYDPYYWTDIQRQAGQMDELIKDFNERVGLVQQYRINLWRQGKPCRYFFDRCTPMDPYLWMVILLLPPSFWSALIPHPRDLEIARLLGWYRIPLRSAPKVVNVDYLAFYQAAAFGEAHRWQIETIAEVRGHELTTRAELLRDEPDHPRAREEYYKIQLGALETLPRPIPARRWRRITFLYTTGALLREARTINDLVVRSEERDILWRSLRERALNAGAVPGRGSAGNRPGPGPAGLAGRLG